MALLRLTVTNSIKQKRLVSSLKQGVIYI